MSTVFDWGRTFLDNSGNVLSGGSATFYIAGSVVTKIAIYPTAADQAAGTNALSNPQTLSSAGRLPQQVHSVGPCRVVVKDSTGATVYDEDNIVTTDYSALTAANFYPSQHVAQYGTVGTSDDTTTIQAAFTAGYVYLPKATYIISNVTIPTGTKIISDGATLKMKTGATGNMVTMTNVADVDIIGTLYLDGQDTTTYVSGSTASNRTGMRITGASTVRVSIDRLVAKGFTNRGVLIDNLDYSDHGTGVRIGHLTAYTNYCALDFDTRGEYCKVEDVDIRLCRIGVRVNAGNNSILGGTIADNVDGMQVLNGTNDAHGIVQGVHFNHNSQWALYCSSVTNGMTFANCHWYYASVYLLTSTGINIYGGQVGESTWYFQGGGRNWVTDIRINNNVTFTHGYNTTQSYVEVRARSFAGTDSREFNRSFYDLPSTSITAISGLTTEQTVKFTSVGTKLYGVTSGTPVTTAYDSSTGIGTVPANGRYAFVFSLRLTNNAASVTKGFIYVRKNGSTITSLYTTFYLAASVTGVQVPLQGILQMDANDTWDVRIAVETAVNTIDVVNTTARMEVYAL